MAQSLSKILLHIIFSTKNRHPLITDDVKNDLHAYIAKICRTHESQCFKVGGTDNHMILVDLTNKDLTGKAAEKILEEANITVNKNGIPYDTKSPFVTSGIRIGTPALTTRGMKEEEMKEVAVLILRALSNGDSPKELEVIKNDVANLCKKFPLYRD